LEISQLVTRKENEMKEQEKYNGWTNYATWRINLEVFDGMESCRGMTAESCKELVEQHIESQSSHLALSYAMAFLSDVNWHEIAEHLNEDMEVTK